MLPTESRIKLERALLQNAIDKWHSDCIVYQLMIDVRLHKIILEQERSRLSHIKNLDKYQQMRLHHCEKLIAAKTVVRVGLESPYMLFNDPGCTLDYLKRKLNNAIEELRFTKFLMAAFNNHVYEETPITPEEFMKNIELPKDDISDLVPVVVDIHKLLGHLHRPSSEIDSSPHYRMGLIRHIFDSYGLKYNKDYDFCIVIKGNLTECVKKYNDLTFGDKDPPYVEECPYLQDCHKSSESTCRGCNTWIAKYHIDKLDNDSFNSMFDAFCLGQSETEHIKAGDVCCRNPNIYCGVGCKYFKYAKKPHNNLFQGDHAF